MSPELPPNSGLDGVSSCSQGGHSHRHCGLLLVPSTLSHFLHEQRSCLSPFTQPRVAACFPFFPPEVWEWQGKLDISLSLLPSPTYSFHASLHKNLYYGHCNGQLLFDMSSPKLCMCNLTKTYLMCKYYPPFLWSTPRQYKLTPMWLTTLRSSTKLKWKLRDSRLGGLALNHIK